MRRAYPSDLSETRWKLIQKLIEEEQQRGRKRSTPLREVVNAMNYRWTTGCPWRMLPHDFPAWETVYTYFDRWKKDGRLRAIREILLRKSPYVPCEFPEKCHPDSTATSRQTALFRGDSQRLGERTDPLRELRQISSHY